MKNAHFTKQERDIILWLRILTAGFAVTEILFVFHPNYLLQYLDNFGLVFFNFQSLPLQPPQYEIWWVGTLALLGVLIVACFQAQSNWLKHHNLVPVVITAKAISFLGFLILCLVYPAHFFYIVGCLVDGVICAVTGYAYAQATKSRPF